MGYSTAIVFAEPNEVGDQTFNMSSKQTKIEHT